MPICEYFTSRFTTLKPPLIVPENPIKLLRKLNRRHVTFFTIGFLAWTFDAFDFFCVSLNVISISRTFDKPTAHITWAIAITLMLRSIGAIIFGIAGDRYGRKWPFIINIIFYSMAGIASGFSRTFTQFIIFRALFGIAMGGIYGNCAATALEDAPIVTRGLLSGLLQQGYSVGFLLASICNHLITDSQRYGWRAMFWFGGIPPLFVALWRVFLPETDAFLRVKQAREQQASNSNETSSAMERFLLTVRPALHDHWPILIYLVLMMAGFNFLAHGSQDLYPTFLASTLQFSPTLITITTSVASCGALIGGILCGYFSSFFGRRLLILVTLIVSAALVPAYTLSEGKTIIIGAFFEQMCVQGVWGVVPVHLIELSPVQMRSFVVGVSYQLGNLISSVSATIEAKVGEQFRKEPSALTETTSLHGEHYDYSKVIAVFLLSVYVYLFLIILIGPEKRNTDETITEVKIKDEQKEEELEKIEV